MSLRAASACLGLAFASGLVLAGIRFASDRASPPWLAKLHGFAAAAGLGLLLRVTTSTTADGLAATQRRFARVAEHFQLEQIGRAHV